MPILIINMLLCEKVNAMCNKSIGYKAYTLIRWRQKITTIKLLLLKGTRWHQNHYFLCQNLDNS